MSTYINSCNLKIPSKNKILSIGLYLKGNVPLYKILEDPVDE